MTEFTYDDLIKKLKAKGVKLSAIELLNTTNLRNMKSDDFHALLYIFDEIYLAGRYKNGVSD